MLNIKLILRNLFKIKSYAVLNILGLGIGLACTFAVIVWVKNELSYDRSLPDADRIYRLTFETNISGIRSHFARCWEKWVWQMPETFPQIDEMVRLDPYRHTAVKIGENKFYSDKVFATDTNFFKIFDIALLYGDVDQVLTAPNSAVISESLSHKYFGNSNPVGQTILFSGEYDTKMGLFNIKGVMKDTPSNSHIHFDILTSFAKPDEPPDWAYVYLLLKPNTSPDDILNGFPSFIKKIFDKEYQDVFTPHLQKITDIHLYSDKDREVEQNGSIKSVYLFIIIAFVLLLISWVNYYNLNKARLMTLQKQINIQRITGSDNKLIILQSIAESGICVILSLILALFIISIAENPAKTLFDINLLPNGFGGLLSSWIIVMGFLIVSVLVGSMPLIIYTIKGKSTIHGFKETNSNNILPGISSYAVLMTTQFCLAIILMVASVIIYKQNEFMLSRSIGNMNNDILVLKRQNWEIRSKYNVFRNRAMQDPLIKSVTASMEEPSGETLDALQVESTGFKDNTEIKRLYVISVEDNFFDFFNIPLVAGRNFSQYNAERKGEDYILNETALKLLGWTPEEAIGQPFRIKFDTPDIFYGGTVVGVVPDFNFTTVKQKIKPYVFFQKPIFYLCFLVKVDSAKKDEAIAHLKKIWDEELPDYPFQYEFIGDLYRSAYSKEFSQSKMVGFFAFLSIIIICFGLFSVTSVFVAKRTKEIGIRKVNGAKTANVLIMLNSGFIKWVAIAFLIAAPVAWFLMNRWLQNFVYRTGVKWWFFAFSGIIVLMVSLLTVSLQSLRAAARNPVESLRYE
jgi:putative ABC transport system permease protein